MSSSPDTFDGARPAAKPARRLRVLFFLPTLGRGGAERVVHTFLERLDRDRFEPELAVVHDVRVHDVPADVLVHTVDDRPMPSVAPRIELASELHDQNADAIEYLQVTAGKLAELVAERSPDVVVSAPLWGSIVASLASGLFPPSTRLAARVNALPSCTLEGNEHEQLFSAMASVYLPKADRVIAVSEAVKGDLVGTFGVPAERIDVLYNPIDVTKAAGYAQAAASYESAGRVRVLFAGRLEPVKQVDVLLEAMAELRGTLDAQLTIAGDGSDADRLRVRASELGVTDIADFAGWQADPYRLMAASDVLVLPSRSEGLGNVLIEAMACGCPVVATEVPGGATAELLLDGRAGLLVPQRDARAIADAIVRLSTDADLRASLVATARERAREFDIPAVVAANQALFTEIVAELSAREGEVSATVSYAAPSRDAAPPARTSVWGRLFGGRERGAGR